MSKRATRAKRKRFAEEEAAIRKVISEWGPIGFPVPDDEYDCLVHQLLSLLHAGGNRDDVAGKIEEELRDHFGLSSVSSRGIASVAGRVWSCWQRLQTTR